MAMERRQLSLVFIDPVKEVRVKASLNVVSEAEYLTGSGRLFQVSAEAQLKERRPKFRLTAKFVGGYGQIWTAVCL